MSPSIAKVFGETVLQSDLNYTTLLSIAECRCCLHSM